MKARLITVYVMLAGRLARSVAWPKSPRTTKPRTRRRGSTTRRKTLAPGEEAREETEAEEDVELHRRKTTM